MMADPILINGYVVTPRGVKLCRPPKLCSIWLDTPQQGAFIKEECERVVDAERSADQVLGPPPDPGQRNMPQRTTDAWLTHQSA